MLAVLGATLLSPSSGAFAQTAADTTEWSSIKWWHPVVVSAGISTLFLIDEPVADGIQDMRSETTDDIGDIAKTFKDPEVFYVASAGAVIAGLATQNPDVTRTGLHIFTSYALAGAMVITTKSAFGRSRPSGTPDDPTNFDLFGGGENSSFPSGSAAVVFSLATTLSDAIDHPAASVLLFTGAGLNSWSRLNGNRHWLSDVVFGAVLGMTSARLVNGRWRIFGIAPPAVWLGESGATVGYRVGW